MASVITCEHCGSPLPEGAIFCGECGRAVSAGSARRQAQPAAEQQTAPPPLQVPDPHGRPTRDPASEAWLPEATLDPATRAWLAGRDRSTGAPGPAVDPQPTGGGHEPRSAPSHVHGSVSGLAPRPGQAPAAPQGRPPALPSDDELDAVTIRRAPSVEPALDPPSDSPRPPAEPSLDPDAFPNEPTAMPLADALESAPTTGAWTHHAEPVRPPEPVAPSWWVGRSRSDAAEVTPEPPTSAAPTTGRADGGPSSPGVSPVDGGPDGTSSGQHVGDTDPDAPSADVPGRPDGGADRPVAGDTAVVEPLAGRRVPRRAPLVQPGQHASTCHVCGHQLEPDDIFCEECGAVRGAVTAAFTGPVVPLPLERPDWAAALEDPESDPEDAAQSGDPGSADGSGDPGREDRSGDRVPTGDAAAPTSLDVTSDRWGASDHGADARTVDTGRAPLPGSPTLPSSAPRAGAVALGPFVAPLPPLGDAVATPASDPVPSSADADEAAALDEDVEVTRIVGHRSGQAPFVLHFSTGERVDVGGTGLLGRLPRPGEDEHFDALVTIRDPGKSVSKTHLEFGRDGDDLWVTDRFSGNGTMVRHIDGSIRNCEPGRRYRVERGARVDIGEQFFLVQ